MNNCASAEDREHLLQNRALQDSKMSKRFTWGSEQVEEFFNLLRTSYHDYLMAKELRRMDEFYEMLGSCMGTDGLVVQNFLKKTGRAYRDILLQAETCEEGCQLPERKLRGSARIYALYEEYYQMYYLGAVPMKPEEEASGSFPQKMITSHNDRKRKHLPDAVMCKRRSVDRSPVAELYDREETIVDVGYNEGIDHVPEDIEPVSGLHLQGSEDALRDVGGLHLQSSENALRDLGHVSADPVPAETASRVVIENGQTSPSPPLPPRSRSRNSDGKRGKGHRLENPQSDGIFGTTTTDFQERFLKLMENQNHILATIVDELNMIKHAVLDANGLQTITYVK